MQVNPRGGGKSNPMSAIVIDTSQVETPVTLQRFQDLPISQEPHLAVNFLQGGDRFFIEEATETN